MDNFADFKTKAINRQPALYETELSNVQVDSENAVLVDGKKLPLSTGGFNDLREMAGVSKKFSKRADEYMGDGTSTRIVEAMRSGMANQDEDTDVGVAIDRTEEEVIGFNDNVDSMISIEGYFELAERIIDDYGLDVDRTTIGHDGTVRLSMKNTDRNVNLDNFGAALENEQYQTGISLSSRLGQVEFESFLYRLICTNGMIGEFFGDDMSINAVDQDSMFTFFNKMDKLAENHFLPEDFADSVNRANDSYASLRELEDIHSTIRSFSDDPQNQHVEAFVPLRDVHSTYREDGIEPTELTQRQKRNAVTPMKLWDAINQLTKFASHDQTSRGFNFSDRDADRMMIQAGSMLERNRFDMENLVPVPDGIRLN